MYNKFVDINTIRRFIKIGEFFVKDHALIESFKERIDFDDIFFAINNGEIIENYPERNRCLIFATLQTKLYLHIVVDYYSETYIDIVTVYIPNSKKWIKGRIRRR
ncbi:MAG: hypothetical protein AUJ85_05850 [Elusimicrobia bacterium CG1_02_37_114]|nr:MAG: hypothetical protein AUJ85_05850 [Elusimicrobia bacterium CG1_02_37_114]